MLKNLNDYGDTGRIMIKVLKWGWLWTFLVTISIIEIMGLLGRGNLILLSLSIFNETSARQQEFWSLLTTLYLALTFIPYALLFLIYIWLPRIKK